MPREALKMSASLEIPDLDRRPTEGDAATIVQGERRPCELRGAQHDERLAARRVPHAEIADEATTVEVKRDRRDLRAVPVQAMQARAGPELP